MARIPVSPEYRAHAPAPPPGSVPERSDFDFGAESQALNLAYFGFQSWVCFMFSTYRQHSMLPFRIATRYQNSILVRFDFTLTPTMYADR